MPLVHGEGCFTQTFFIVERHGPAIEDKLKEALIMPDRVNDNSKLWNVIKTDARLFKKEAGREIDEID